MDFTLSDEQQAIAKLAGRILAEQCPVETLRTLEREDEHFAADAWFALAGADLLGLAVPEPQGGSGLGVLEAGLVAEQVGRHVAPVPFWTSTAGALAVARWGGDELRRRRLPGALDGTAPLAVALWEPAERGSLDRPAVLASPVEGGWRLDGVKAPVPWARHATALVVSVRLGDEARGVFVVETGAPGVELTDEQALTREPVQTVSFDGVQVTEADLLARGPDLGAAGGNGQDGHPDVVGWLAERTTALLVGTALGVCGEALALTARYVSERKQFGSPIGTFQAVAHRCADAYVDTEAIRLTATEALWRLDAGLDARAPLAVAAMWAAEGGDRIVHAAQHLHGGIGMDLDYPVHRYFRWATSLGALLGGTHGALGQLGAALAAGDIVMA